MGTQRDQRQGFDFFSTNAGTRRFRRLRAGRKSTGIAVATLHRLASHIHYPTSPWIAAATVSTSTS
ncbi:hypothetical protein T09_13184 [Trichinella sp. T9]|nr:hypothetical protein T09_13184 [Trichinella sp. T9]